MKRAEADRDQLVTVLGGHPAGMTGLCSAIQDWLDIQHPDSVPELLCG
jgi:hypothetical protein